MEANGNIEHDRDFVTDEGSTDMSSSIAKLAAALAKAQGNISAASKDKTNPHFKSRYADLASVWEACRGPLSDNGLAIVQLVASRGSVVTVTTILTHDSGEWIRGALTLTARGSGPQDVGSAITYGRRYGLAAMVGVVADEDDDGNAASGRPAPQQEHRESKPAPAEDPKKAIESWAARIKACTTADALKALVAEINALPDMLAAQVKKLYAEHKKSLAKPPGEVTKDLINNPLGDRTPGEEG
jgi:hypothetical protein